MRDEFLEVEFHCRAPKLKTRFLGFGMLLIKFAASKPDDETDHVSKLDCVGFRNTTRKL